MGLVVGVVGVDVVLVGVGDCPEFWVVVHCCLRCIFREVYVLVGVYYIGLGSLDYSFVGRKVFLLCVMRFLLVLSGLYNSFGSLWMTLSVCH